MQEKSGSLIEWLVPMSFILFSGWLIWHMPAFTLDFAPPQDPSQFDKLSALFKRIDVTPDMPGLFGGFADALDWLSLVMVPILLVVGEMGVGCEAVL